ncbi:hypothetical protein SNEBB_008724 [Seison nebaliae]|nr:hypothetical protein SNEBB_008724 [Seison nebaliae]
MNYFRKIFIIFLLNNNDADKSNDYFPMMYIGQDKHVSTLQRILNQLKTETKWRKPKNYFENPYLKF